LKDSETRHILRFEDEKKNFFCELENDEPERISSLKVEPPRAKTICHWRRAWEETGN